MLPGGARGFPHHHSTIVLLVLCFIACGLWYRPVLDPGSQPPLHNRVWPAGSPALSAALA